jgi:hypothetical protein
MEKSKFRGLLFIGAGLICMPVLASIITLAQEPATVSAVAMPKDPKALMILAAKMNGLTSPDIKPWHLKAMYTLLDASGMTTDEGTIEVLWANNQKYKIAWTGRTLSRTLYRSRNGRQQTDTGTSLPDVLGWAVNEFVWPILPPDALKGLKFEQEDFEANSEKLVCLTLKDPHKMTMGGFLAPTYCLESKAPALRIGSHEGDLHQFLRNNIFTFQGRYMPRDIVAVIANKPDLKVHLESLEILNMVDDADFAPPKHVRPLK